MDQLSLQKLGTLGFNLDVIMVNSDPWIKLHSVEVSEQIDRSSFFSETWTYNSLLGHRTVKRCSHSVSCLVFLVLAKREGVLD